MFAIEEVDPRLGRLELLQVNSGRLVDEVKTPVELIDCQELFEKGGFNNKHIDYEEFTRLTPKKWLCPDALDSLEVRGGWGSDYFNYLSLKILGCELGD